MRARSLTVALLLGMGLLLAIGPRSARNVPDQAVGNCYSEDASYSTPTICE